jgi:hypothetical protein
MAWIPDRFNLSPDRPGPSLHITAAATSLTSFINVSGQPKSRKREQKLFPAKSYMPRRYRILRRLSGILRSSTYSGANKSFAPDMLIWSFLYGVSQSCWA